MKNTEMAWVTYNAEYHVYEITSNSARTEYYLYKDGKKVKTATAPDKFDDYIKKCESRENK